jgi:hypothetical protein
MTSAYPGTDGTRDLVGATTDEWLALTTAAGLEQAAASNDRWGFAE